MTPHMEELSEFYRYGLRAWSDMISARLDGAQRLRKQQLAALDRALSTHARFVAEIDNAECGEALVAVQAKLLRTQFESVTGYWVGTFQVGTLQPLVDMTSSVYTLAARASEAIAKRSANQ